MDWVKNLKIAHKLLVLIIVSLIFVLIVGLVGYYYTSKSNRDIKLLYERNLLTISDLGVIRGNYEQGIADVLYLFDDISTAQKQHWQADLKGLRAKNSKLLKAYQESNISDYEKEHIEKIINTSGVYWANMYTAIGYANKKQDNVASKIFDSNLHYIIDERAQLKDLIEYNQKAAEKIHIQNTRAAKTANIILIATILESFALLIALGLMISKMITGPITQAVEDLEEGATQVAAASEQLSAASEQLAAGSSEQASAIQETSSSIEESDSMVKQNTENTQQAAILAKKAKDYADKSNK